MKMTKSRSPSITTTFMIILLALVLVAREGVGSVSLMIVQPEPTPGRNEQVGQGELMEPGARNSKVVAASSAFFFGSPGIRYDT
jgi:hypothetical protein